MLAGAVEPKLDPSMLELTTKKRSVSIAQPGPTRLAQLPSNEPTPARSMKRWLEVSPCVRRTTLSRSGASVPVVA